MDKILFKPFCLTFEPFFFKGENATKQIWKLILNPNS